MEPADQIPRPRSRPPQVTNDNSKQGESNAINQNFMENNNDESESSLVNHKIVSSSTTPRWYESSADKIIVRDMR